MAAGRYFKVVDSDDWVDGDAFRQVLDCLRKQEASGFDLDALVVNYVYEYFYNGTQRVVNYSNAFKHDQDFGWERLRRLTLTQLLGMHSLIHRTDLLRSCGICLPEHTFYVDSLLVYKPMPYIRRIHYLNVDFYRYFIGRADQSVNSAVLIQRVDQHIRVAMALVTMYPVEREIKDPDLRRYMYRFQSMLVSITIIHLILAGDDQSLAKIGRIWQDIRQYDEKAYRIIRRSFISRAVSIPGRGGRYITRKGFGVVRKILKFS